MKYNKALFKGYDKILVTGPMRSGTTIASKIISEDLGYKLIDERDHQDVPKTTDTIINVFDNFVIQGPGLSSYIELLSKDVLIVFMVRNCGDIIRSEKRVGWDAQVKELNKYIEQYEPKVLQYLQPISLLKYRMWIEVQRANIKNFIELEYESLKSHKLWVNEGERKNFTGKQTEIGVAV